MREAAPGEGEEKEDGCSRRSCDDFLAGRREHGSGSAIRKICGTNSGTMSAAPLEGASCSGVQDRTAAGGTPELLDLRLARGRCVMAGAGNRDGKPEADGVTHVKGGAPPGRTV